MDNQKSNEAKGSTIGGSGNWNAGKDNNAGSLSKTTMGTRARTS